MSNPSAAGASGIRIVTDLPEDQWRTFVDRHPQGNIFHTPEMFQVFSQVEGYQPLLWAAVYEDGRIAALFLPVFVTLNPLLGPLTRRAIVYGSVLCSPEADSCQALSMVLKSYLRLNKQKCLFTELRNVSSMEAEQPVFREHGFTYQPYLNYLIDLSRPTREVFLNIGARTRKNIKRGLNKNDVLVKEVTDAGQIGECFNLLSQTYQAAKVPLTPLSMFEAAFRLLYPKKLVRFTLAYIDGHPAAVSVELLYKNVMYGWFGGMDRAYGKYNPNEMLMWHLLKWGTENGYRLYDFGGAGKPDEEYGVRDFKAKFGGELVSYGRNVYVHRPGLLWVSQQGYQVIRNLTKGRFSMVVK